MKFISDNQAVVTVLSKLYSHEALLMGYLRCLVFSAAKHGFWFTAEHIPGSQNTFADAISRNKMDLFLAQAPPTMSKTPEELPLEIDQLLCLQNPNWFCPTWRRLFSSITQKA